MTRVLLADDHGLVLSGLRALLSTESDLEIIGACVNGAEVVEFVAQDPPDVLVMDLKMPKLTGIEVIERLQADDMLPPTILIAADIASNQVTDALRHGAWGVVLKDQAPQRLLEHIYSAIDGEEWVPDLPEDLQKMGTADDMLGQLTEREEAIARLAARGASNKAISKSLGIAQGTVKVHLHRIYRKTGLANRVQLALHLREAGAA